MDTHALQFSIILNTSSVVKIPENWYNVTAAMILRTMNLPLLRQPLRRVFPLHLLCVLLTFTLCAGCKKQDTAALPEIPVKSVTLEPGSTLGESMQETDLSAEERTAIVQKLSTVFSPKRCKAGDRFEIVISTDKQWSRFTYYQPGTREYYVVEKTTNGISAQKQEKPAVKRTVTARGSVRSSLWEAMRGQKVEPGLIVDFADIFACQFDFLTDTQKGDTYKILWEEFATADGAAYNRHIIAAQYVSGSTTHTAFHFVNKKGEGAYYSPEGKSMQSFFLRAPLQFRRISSYFTLRRFHPILKIFRPHLGIDYAAPTGTPVSAIGEGTVTFAGWKGGFGNFVGIRHPNGYESFYGHLSRFGKGVRRGSHVSQGQVIASVGATGLASGPHLDFRVKKDGRFINYLKLKFPSATAVGKDDAAAYAETRKELYTQLAEIR